MHKYKHGFTLIELLIVIAIVGILAGAIIFNTGGSKIKAQLAGFKGDTRGSLAGLATQCITTGADIPRPANTKNTNWADFTSKCDGSGNFIITATSTNASIDCKAWVNQGGVKYFKADNVTPC